MTARDRIINTLCHQICTPVPSLLTIPESVGKKRASDCAQLRTRFQSDMDLLDYSLPTLPIQKANSGEKTTCVDEWGCAWNCSEDGVCALSEESLYDDILKIEGVRFPQNPVTLEMVEEVNQFCDSNSHFVLVQTRIHPFRRLCALGGTASACRQFQRKPRELREIMTRLYEYYRKQLNTWCLTDCDAIGLEDDLTDENGGRMALKRWNEILVPMYKEFCAKIRSCDKFSFFTGTGNFEEYIPGLIAAGVDCIRFDASLIDAKLLADRYGNQVAFQPILKPEKFENETEKTLSEKILAMRSAFSEAKIIMECQMPLKTPTRRVACAMLNLRRRMPQPGDFS
ncbi:MAG: hypothetical protein K6C40_02690 [Thermoguttaceae bacterium]|nr:hypothetical protein [Thermoguttaceae bacterium]